MLECGHEGKFDAFTRRVARLGRRLECGADQGVTRLGVRLEPEDLAARWTHVGARISRRKPFERHDTTRSLRGVAQRRVGSDRIQPRAHRAAPLEAAQTLPRPEQCLLQRVFRIGHGPEQPVAVRVQRRAMLSDELIERATISPARRRNDLWFGCWSASHSRFLGAHEPASQVYVLLRHFRMRPALSPARVIPPGPTLRA